MLPSQAQIAIWVNFIRRFGPLWTGTKLSGYAETGPYHCDDCIYLRGRTDNAIYFDLAGQGRCSHPLVKIDPEVRRDSTGSAIVDVERGCCEFVDNTGLK